MFELRGFAVVFFTYSLLFILLRFATHSRPEDNRHGLQIPDSAVASYFREESSGAWVLQTPVEPHARESHRRPIGFVTSGFVRGRSVDLLFLP